VDKIRVGHGSRGPITEAIQRRFFDIVRGDAPDTHGWLTYVPAPAAMGASKSRVANDR
jgi:branched-chain amino acid aminotransferase